jgi:hypothetical protein
MSLELIGMVYKLIHPHREKMFYVYGSQSEQPAAAPPADVEKHSQLGSRA